MFVIAWEREICVSVVEVVGFVCESLVNACSFRINTLKRKEEEQDFGSVFESCKSGLGLKEKEL